MKLLKTILAYMMLGLIIMIMAMLSSCAVNPKSDDEAKRFARENGGAGVELLTDTATGCKYITTGGTYSSYTYVHGSCPDIIKEESK